LGTFTIIFNFSSTVESNVQYQFLAIGDGNIAFGDTIGTLQGFSLTVNTTTSSTESGILTDFLSFFIFGGSTANLNISITNQDDLGDFVILQISQTEFDNNDNLIITNDSSEWITAGFGDDFILASAGFDTYDGESGEDTLSYENFTDGVTIIDGRGLAGAARGHTLFDIENIIGTSDDDILQNGASNANLFGGAGNDRLSSGPNDVFLTGGTGNDVFFLGQRGDQTATITDFTIGEDQIDLSASSITDFSDIQPLLEQDFFNENNAILSLQTGSLREEFILENINAADLSASDFIFAIPVTESVVQTIIMTNYSVKMAMIFLQAGEA